MVPVHVSFSGAQFSLVLRTAYKSLRLAHICCVTYCPLRQPARWNLHLHSNYKSTAPKRRTPQRKRVEICSLSSRLALTINYPLQFPYDNYHSTFETELGAEIQLNEMLAQCPQLCFGETGCGAYMHWRKGFTSKLFVVI